MHMLMLLRGRGGSTNMASSGGCQTSVPVSKRLLPPLDGRWQPWPSPELPRLCFFARGWRKRRRKRFVMVPQSESPYTNHAPKASQRTWPRRRPFLAIRSGAQTAQIVPSSVILQKSPRPLSKSTRSLSSSLSFLYRKVLKLYQNQPAIHIFKWADLPSALWAGLPSAWAAGRNQPVSLFSFYPALIFLFKSEFFQNSYKITKKYK
jgi:hypothetical protein